MTLPIDPAPPIAVEELAHIGAGLRFMDAPTDYLQELRRRHGDTFLLDVFGFQLLMTFAPRGLQHLYELPEEQASFGLATFDLIGFKTPTEIFLDVDTELFRELLLHKRIHIGIAVAVTGGLLVPVIRDADKLNLAGLARAVNDLAARSRGNKLSPDELQGGTFTVTNHGVSGSLLGTPIINQPQAGILGIGKINKRAAVRAGGHPLLPSADDAIVIRPMCYLSFSFDHRVLNGAEADGFVGKIVEILENWG